MLKLDSMPLPVDSFPMNPAELQIQLVDDMLLLPDARTRLDALAAWGSKAPELPAEDAMPENAVPGCVSRVHLDSRCDSGCMHFRLLADSVIVRGLVGVTVRIADGQAAADLSDFYFDWPAKLSLERQISPTRLNGLTAVARRIQSLARLQVGYHVD